ncbi:MAG: carboxypeptidase regulatory-like domain-containing protein [Acidobacteria bacterium]|nr:carboxypeptidase regulatory-like domain-containing protein [Acidobacteriota bacterium]
MLVDAKSRRQLRFLFAFAAIVSMIPATAQQYYGSLTGVVTDSSGAPVIAAKVLITSLAKGTNVALETNTEGIFQAVNLTPDTYRLEVTMNGFKKLVREPLLVESNRVLTADVQLQLGDVNQTVDVSGAPPIIETERSQTTQTFEGKLVLQAPLDVNARSDMRTIIASLPGANYGFSGRMLINGARTAQVSFDNDGLANRSPYAGNMQQESSVNVDSLASIKFTLVNAGAESRAPAQVSAITKSGTNQFHGSVFLDTMHSIFNANDHNAPEGAAKPFARTNYLGYSVDGPVYLPKLYDGRNRTFFLNSLTVMSAPWRTDGFVTSPDANLRSGDFSSFRDPNGDLIVITDPTTGLPFAGNKIPTARIYKGSSDYLNKIYPLPNRAGYQDNLFLPTLSETDGKSVRMDLRVDQVINDKNNFFVRYSRLWNPEGAAYRDFGVGMNASLFTIDSFVVTDSHIFRPNLINEFRIGRSSVYNTQYIGLRTSEIVSLLGLQGIPSSLTGPERHNVPDLNITGAQYITPWVGDGIGKNNLWEIFDNATWVHKRHNIKFGTNWRRDENYNYSYDRPGTFNFNGTFTGYGLSDFLLGAPATAVRPYPRAALGPDIKSAWYMGWWIQDDFKVNQRLTLNLGLRWDVNFPGKADGDLYYNFDPKTGNLVLPNQQAIDAIVPVFPKTIKTVTAAQAGFPSRLRKADMNNFAPRIGFAYRPWGDKTVIRGAYGIYTNEISLSYLVGLAWSSPWGGNETFTNRFTNGQPLWQWPAAFPTNEVGDSSFGGTYAAGGFIGNLKNPYTQQWNFTLERQIASTAFRLQYVGVKSTQLLWLRGGWGDYNTPAPSTIPFTESRRPYPQYGQIQYLENGGNQIYHGLNIAAERRLAQGMTFNSQFTWSRNFTDTYDGPGDLPDLRYDLGLGNPVWNRQGMRGNQPENPKFKWTTIFISDLPFGRGKWIGRNWNPFLNQVLGGWALSGNLNIETGWWMSPLYWGGTDPSSTNFRQGSPDVVGDINFRNTNLQPGQLFLNPKAFKIPDESIGRFGNAGLTFLQEPTWWVFDMGIHKVFPIKERLRFEINARMQDAFNHGYYWHRSMAWNMDANDPANFGRFQGNVSGSRVISFVGRLAW